MFVPVLHMSSSFFQLSIQSNWIIFRGNPEMIHVWCSWYWNDCLKTIHCPFPSAPGCCGDTGPGGMDGEDILCAGGEPPGGGAGGDLPLWQDTLPGRHQGADAHSWRPRLPLAGLLLRFHPSPNDRRQSPCLPLWGLCRRRQHHQWSILAHGSRELVSMTTVHFSPPSLLIVAYCWGRLTYGVS